MKENQVIVHLHVIKTGGSTIALQLHKHDFPIFDMATGPEIGMDQVRFIQGHHANIHFKVPDREILFMTVLRDPADWLVSVYHHDCARKHGVIPFDRWYEARGSNTINVVGRYPNPMLKWINAMQVWGTELEDVEMALDLCWFVGLTEKLDEDLPALFRFLGLPEDYENKRVCGEWDEVDGTMIEKRYELTPEMRERIYYDNPLDVALYQYAVERHAATRGNLEG